MPVHWKGGKAGAEGDASVTLVSKTLTVGAAVDNGDGTVTITVAHADDFDKFEVVKVEKVLNCPIVNPMSRRSSRSGRVE